MGTKIYLLASPEELCEAMKTGMRLAPAAFRFGENGELFIRKDIPDIGECCFAIDCDAVTPNTPLNIDDRMEDVILFGKGAGYVCREMRRMGINAFASCDNCPDGVPAVVSTAVSGGTVKSFIMDSRTGYGRIAVMAEVTRMRFTLPEMSGVGKSLTCDELVSLAGSFGGHPFFSEKLMACYFSYSDPGGTHFVLYDNSESMERKLKLMKELGVELIFLNYPDVKEMLPSLKTVI